jgi:hypothetical protein
MKTTMPPKNPPPTLKCRYNYDEASEEGIGQSFVLFVLVPMLILIIVGLAVWL